MARRRLLKGLTDPRKGSSRTFDPFEGFSDEDMADVAKADTYGARLMDWDTRAGTVASIGLEDGEVEVTKADGQEPPKSRQIKDPFENLYTYGNAIIPPLDPYRLLQIPENNAVHAACVTAKAADAVGRGWVWEPTNKDADPNKVEALDQLLEDITPGLSFSELLRQAVWEKEAIGWSGWEVARDGDKDVFLGQNEKVAALFPMPAHTIRATKDENVWVQIKNVEIRYFKVFGCKEPYDAFTGKVVSDDVLKAYMAGGKDARGKQVKFEPAREIIVFRTYTPRSPYYGVPSWIGAMPAIAELQAIREFNISFFQSGGTVDRIIHVKGDDAVVAENMATKIHETIRDAAGRGHVTVITHGNQGSDVEVKPMNGPQGPVGGRDAQFVKRRDDLIKEVLMAHNVPPYRIGLAELGALGGSAAKEMLRSYKVGAIESEQTVLQDRLNHTLFGPDGLAVQDFAWKLESLDWDETELNLSIGVQGVDSGIISRNEARDLIGQERYEDPAMDKITATASSLVPVTTSSEAAALKDIIGQWKTAMEAVIRGDPPPPPPGAPAPGQTPAAGQTTPAAPKPQAPAPAAPAQPAPAAKAELVEIEKRLGDIEALLVERVEKADQNDPALADAVSRLAESATALRRDDRSEGRADIRDYVTSLAEQLAAKAAEAATEAVGRALAERDAAAVAKDGRLALAITKLAEATRDAAQRAPADRREALLRSVDQLTLLQP